MLSVPHKPGIYQITNHEAGITYSVEVSIPAQVRPLDEDSYPRPIENGEAGSTEQLLAARQHEYGGFDRNARMTQQMMRNLEDALLEHDEGLNDQQREGFHMVFHKISRFACGHRKSRRKHTEDMCGYMQLIHEATE